MQGFRAAAASGLTQAQPCGGSARSPAAG